MVTLLSGEEVEEFRDYANCDFDYWIRGEGEELGNAKYYNVRLEEIGDYTPMRMNTYVRPVIRIGYKSADIEYINPIDIESLSLGDIVTYGKYNGEPINWYVVNIVGNNATLLCVDTMEAQPYNNEQLVVTWGGSTLRTWLNEVFYNEAFSVSEKKWIMPSETRTYEHIKGKGFLRQVAFDKVYILSKDDAFKYTEYLACNHSWWLRDHGNTDNDALFVHDFGKINNDGMEVSAVNIGVRPVITICN